MNDKLSPSEALFAFGGWLSSKEEVITIGATSDCAVLAEKINEFCEANDLEEPRQDWENNIVYPSGKEITDG
jgi:hypothetical protein